MDPLAHASIGLMTKAAFPKAPLFPLLLATQLPDLLFFGFEAAGIERQAVTRMDFGAGLTYLSPPHFPWSHGLSLCIVWSILAGGLTMLIFRNRTAGLLAGICVFSHWFLDFLSYSNLPVYWKDSPMIGIGLINTGPGVAVGIVLEIILIFGGITAFWISRKRALRGVPDLVNRK
jgi:hypothetical protein